MNWCTGSKRVQAGAGGLRLMAGGVNGSWPVQNGPWCVKNTERGTAGSKTGFWWVEGGLPVTGNECCWVKMGVCE